MAYGLKVGDIVKINPDVLPYYEHADEETFEVRVVIDSDSVLLFTPLHGSYYYEQKDLIFVRGG